MIKYRKKSEESKAKNLLKNTKMLFPTTIKKGVSDDNQEKVNVNEDESLRNLIMLRKKKLK